MLTYYDFISMAVCLTIPRTILLVYCPLWYSEGSIWNILCSFHFQSSSFADSHKVAQSSIVTLNHDFNTLSNFWIWKNNHLKLHFTTLDLMWKIVTRHPVVNDNNILIFYNSIKSIVLTYWPIRAKRGSLDLCFGCGKFCI